MIRKGLLDGNARLELLHHLDRALRGSMRLAEQMLAHPDHGAEAQRLLCRLDEIARELDRLRRSGGRLAGAAGALWPNSRPASEGENYGCAPARSAGASQPPVATNPGLRKPAFP